MPIRWVRELEDDFEMFPLQHAMGDLARVIEDWERELETEEIPPPKHRPVPLEMRLEAQSILIGAAFVTGQSMINKTVAILRRAREAGALMLPDNKLGLMSFETESHDGVALIPAINAVANYFKHHDEWTPDWTDAAGLAAQTIREVRAIHLRPESPAPDNLWTAMRAVGAAAPRGVSKISDDVHEWRRRAAARIRVELGLGPEFPDDGDRGEGEGIDAGGARSRSRGTQFST